MDPTEKPEYVKGSYNLADIRKQYEADQVLLGDDVFQRKYGRTTPSFVYKDDVNYNEFGVPQYRCGGINYIIDQMPGPGRPVGRARLQRDKGATRKSRDRDVERTPVPESNDVLILEPVGVDHFKKSQLRIRVTEPLVKRKRAVGHVEFRLVAGAKHPGGRDITRPERSDRLPADTGAPSDSGGHQEHPDPQHV
jgi:hypothetical protein